MNLKRTSFAGVLALATLLPLTACGGSTPIAGSSDSNVVVQSNSDCQPVTASKSTVKGTAWKSKSITPEQTIRLTRAIDTPPVTAEILGNMKANVKRGSAFLTQSTDGTIRITLFKPPNMDLLRTEGYIAGAGYPRVSSTYDTEGNLLTSDIAEGSMSQNPQTDSSMGSLARVVDGAVAVPDAAKAGPDMVVITSTTTDESKPTRLWLTLRNSDKLYQGEIYNTPTCG